MLFIFNANIFLIRIFTSRVKKKKEKIAVKQKYQHEEKCKMAASDQLISSNGKRQYFTRRQANDSLFDVVVVGSSPWAEFGCIYWAAHQCLDQRVCVWTLKYHLNNMTETSMKYWLILCCCFFYYSCHNFTVICFDSKS